LRLMSSVEKAIDLNLTLPCGSDGTPR
jgi:hypothetical protein